MAEVPTTPNGQRPAAPAPRGITAPVIHNHGPSVGKFIVVCFASTFINGTVIGLMIVLSMLLGVNIATADNAQPPIEEKTEVEEVPKEFDLTNTDLGLDDSVPLNYNVDRIEEVSVPGKVDPTQAVGIQNAPEAAPTNVPPPPGTGGGTGAAPFDPNVSGTGSAIGSIGGMGGVYGGGGFAGRSGSTREKMVTEGGGNAASEKAVADGLKWLAAHQFSDGHWGLHNFNQAARTAPLPAGKVERDNSTALTTRNNDTAGTAFGLLPFLAAGITHKPAAKKLQIDYSKAVGAGVTWMVRKQTKTAGGDRGYFGGDQYSHAIATIAMCEAYGLTSDPTLKASAQMGLDYIVKAQHDAGGWRYSPRTAGDTSVTGWMLMALKSGQMSGLAVPKQTLQKVSRYLDSCETSDKGGYGYTDNRGATPAMTAVGALCRQYLGVNPRNPSLLGSVRKIKAVPPGGGNLYYEYYATQVMHHMGGETWNFWNLGPDGTGKKGIRDTLIAKQDQTTTGNKGSWGGDDHVGGRLGATSLSLLTLEVYYRHLPLYRRDAGMAKPDDDK